MPRYFFNVHDGQSLVDDDGTEFPTIEAARTCAVQTAGALLKDHAATFWSGGDWKMDVAEASGLLLFSLHFIAVDAPATASQWLRPLPRH